MADLTADEAVAALERWQQSFDSEQKDALRSVVEHVETRARSNLARQPVPNRPGSLDTRLDGGHPTLALQYRDFPWLAGAEAGSKRYGQFKRYVGFEDRGYIVGAAIRQTADKTGVQVVSTMTQRLKEEFG